MPDSEPLTTIMASGSIEIAEVVRIGREAADSLERGEVHGELWPSAISVGDAVEIVPPGTDDRRRWLQYAAPERVAGRHPTAASDVFALAAILFHVLAGRPPSGGASAVDTLPRGVPGDLATVIKKALSADPAQRYASMGAFRDALASVGARRSWPGRRILVADDDAPIRDLYLHVAARVGVEADVVASGRDAVEAFRTRKYDIALMDLNMPRMSGWEVLDFLRARSEARPHFLFIVTGLSDQQISTADQEVVAAVLFKPVAMDELKNLVDACLRGEALNLGAILKTTCHRVSPAA